MKRRKRNPDPATTLVVFGVIGGLALASFLIVDAEKKSKEKSAEPDGGEDDGTNGGGGGGGDEAIPDYKPVPGKKYAKGPRGKGRVYGKPNIPLPDDLFESNKVLVGPNCAWVVEGEAFLPELGTPSYQGNEIEYDTLLDTLQSDTLEVFPQGAGANHAYGYLAWLVNNADGKIDAKTLTSALFDEGAGLWKFTADRGFTVGSIPTGGAMCANIAPSNLSEPLKFWRQDMEERTVRWLKEYFNTIPFS